MKSAPGELPHALRLPYVARLDHTRQCQAGLSCFPSHSAPLQAAMYYVWLSCVSTGLSSVEITRQSAHVRCNIRQQQHHTTPKRSSNLGALHASHLHSQRRFAYSSFSAQHKKLMLDAAHAPLCGFGLRLLRLTCLPCEKYKTIFISQESGLYLGH